MMGVERLNSTWPPAEEARRSPCVLLLLALGHCLHKARGTSRTSSKSRVLPLGEQLPVCWASSPHLGLFAGGHEPATPAAVANISFSGPLVQVEFSYVCAKCGKKYWHLWSSAWVWVRCWAEVQQKIPTLKVGKSRGLHFYFVTLLFFISVFFLLLWGSFQ